MSERSGGRVRYIDVSIEAIFMIIQHICENKEITANTRLVYGYQKENKDIVRLIVADNNYDWIHLENEMKQIEIIVNEEKIEVLKMLIEQADKIVADMERDEYNRKFRGENDSNG
jgi:hypothetical protein